MKVATHAFRDAFLAKKALGFALQFEDRTGPATASPPFLTRKYDDRHVSVFVFETAVAAEEERRIFPQSCRIQVCEVSVAEVKAFASIGYFDMPALVFLRDSMGAFAPL